MWYTISFIAGALIGVLSMALFAASTMDRMEWENRQFADTLHENNEEISRHRELLDDAFISGSDMKDLSEAAEIAG